MFCPKCAAQNVDGSSFCRVCGANISLVPQALKGNLPISDKTEWPGRDPRRPRKKTRQPRIEDAIQGIVMGLAFTLVSLLVAEYAPGGSVWWFWLLIPAFGCYAKGFGELARVRAAKSQSAQQLQPQLNEVPQQGLPAANTGELRPPVPSVTESTTRHLGVEAKTRPFEFSDTQKPS